MFEAVNDLGWKRVQKQSWPFRRDEKLSCWTIFYQRSSWGSNSSRKTDCDAKHPSLTLPIRHDVWWGAPHFASWQGYIPMALTFAYELGFEWFLYRNRSFRRDEDNPCRSFFHTRLSWGRNEPNSVLNTKIPVFQTQLRPSRWDRMAMTQTLKMFISTTRNFFM